MWGFFSLLTQGSRGEWEGARSKIASLDSTERDSWMNSSIFALTLARVSESMAFSRIRYPFSR
ncbi:MAG: hypothetical protein F4244_01045 [Gammaproteobacteria bacterium]|nr:hypothetical protein [Gammaproteobacteria bacterium]